MRGASRVRRPSSMSVIPRARWPTSSTSRDGATAASSRGCSSADVVFDFVCAREYTTMSQPATTETPKEMPKDASAPVIAQHAATLKALPFSDVRDFDDAARGFLGTVENAKIMSPQGRVVWSLEPYGFLSTEQAPPTVDPSLWRQSRLNMNHGLFEVVPGVYPVRGLDIANMTLIEGDSGVIVVDTLTSIEGARAAMELYFRHRGRRPVAAVIFTHTHTDHWGGARGVLDDETLASGL